MRNMTLYGEEEIDFILEYCYTSYIFSFFMFVYYVRSS